MLRPHHELAPGVVTIADWLVPGEDEEAGDALLATATRRAQEAGREAVFADPAPEYAAFRARGFTALPLAESMERRFTYWVGPR